MTPASTDQTPRLRCQQCRQSHPIDAAIWACPCGGLLDVEMTARFPTEALAQRPPGMWRYREALPLSQDVIPVSLGEVATPLLPVAGAGAALSLKLDYLFPTGSFKDRGAALVLTKVRELGVTSVVEDSSGNAGAAIAAYAAAAGVSATIFAPASAPAAKTAQIRHYGATLVSVPGSRQDTTEAALAMARESYYASHVWNPFFLEGTKTVAFEIWEQLGHNVPEWVIAPVGHGTLLLGLFNGFRQLLQAGAVSHMPRIIGVQAASCAPLAAAWQRGGDSLPPVEPAATIADGIAISRPLRWRQILDAVRTSDGEIVAVSDDQIRAAFLGWARRGIAVEPTSASALAAWHIMSATGRFAPSDRVVAPLTGAGLKTSPGILSQT